MRRRRRGLKSKIRDVVVTLVLLGGVAILAAWFSKNAEQSPSGAARVIDGDSLEVAGTEVRLQGIDAPEYGQTCNSTGKNIPCGRQAAKWFRRLINGRQVVCSGWETDQYGRLLANCVASGVDLNAKMVRDGWAVSYGGYEGEELDARQNKRGLWAGDFERPSDWRKTHSIGGADQATGVVEWLKKMLGL